MALVLSDRVKETTTTTGTGTVNLAGAETGFQTFVAGVGNSNTTYYAIVDNTTGAFEVGIGTVTDASPDTLSRDTILQSSNSDSAVDFAAGTKDVFCTQPADKAVFEDASGNISNTSATTPLTVTTSASSGESAAHFKRSASHGSLVTFENSANVTVGVISTTSNDLLIGTGDTGLYFEDSTNDIEPFNPTNRTSTNGVISLGASTRKFKDLYLGGNITVDGTVDGRDVATDGTKLDGIEASADVTDATNVTAAGALMTSGGTMTGNVVLGDDVTTTFGDGSDLIIKHNGTNSQINNNNGTFQINQFANDSDVVINSDDGSGSTANYFRADGSTGDAILYHYGSEKIKTQSGGVDVTGNITVSGTVDGRDVAADGATADAALPKAGGTMTGNLLLGDSVIIKLGDSQDLQLFHNGTNSQINTSTGNLVFQSLENDKDVVINSDDGSGSTANYFRADGSTGDAILYHYGTEKLKTQSGGVDVTGNILATGNLGIGTTNPLSDIHIAKSSPLIRFQDTDNDAVGQVVYNTASGGLLLRSDTTQATGASGSNIILETDGSEAARIDSSGNLLVGKTSADSATVGQELKSTGVAIFTQSANPPIITNRLSSDGEIVNLRKDGTTIGSIGVANSDNLFLSGDANHSGLSMGSSGVLAYANGNYTDGTEDLGQSSVRWRHLYLSGDITGRDVTLTGSVTSNIDINAQTGTTYTTVLTDRSKLVTLDNASAITVTIPPNSSVAYPTGTKIDLLAKGAGQVTVAAGSGVTVNSAQSLKLRAQWSAASAIKLATDTWVLVGDLQAI